MKWLLPIIPGFALEYSVSQLDLPLGHKLRAFFGLIAAMYCIAWTVRLT